jgi:hypothetical protein
VKGWLVVGLLLLAGCSSGPHARQASSVSGAHVRAQWESELPHGGDRVTPRRGEVARLSRAARGAQAQLIGLRFYRASSGKPAPAVVLAVGDPASFLKYRLRGFLTRLHSLNGLYGDDYVGVVDAAGAFVWENGRAHLPGSFAGSLWIRPDLDSCSPVVHGQPVTAFQPPSCPAA